MKEFINIIIFMIVFRLDHENNNKPINKSMIIMLDLL